MLRSAFSSTLNVSAVGVAAAGVVVATICYVIKGRRSNRKTATGIVVDLCIRGGVELPLAGKTYIVTGANTGLGFAAVRALSVVGGANVILACRDPARGATAMQKLEREIRESVLNSKALRQQQVVQFLPLDLASFESVREFVAEFDKLELALDGLVNNAGIFHLNAPEVGVDGWELMWTVNYAAPFLLTELLQGKLARTHGCVVNVSSKMHEILGWLYWGVLHPLPIVTAPPKPGQFGATTLYAITKAHQIMHAAELSRRWATSDIVGYSVEPGLVRTGISRHQSWAERELTYLLLNPIMKTPEEAAATIVYCLVARPVDTSAVSGGNYYLDCHRSQPASFCLDPTNQAALLALSQRVIAGKEA